MREGTQKSRPATRNSGPFDCYCDRCDSLMVPIVAADRRSEIIGLLPLCPRCDVLEEAVR
jgi:hypothetical protein